MIRFNIWIQYLYDTRSSDEIQLMCLSSSICSKEVYDCIYKTLSNELFKHVPIAWFYEYVLPDVILPVLLKTRDPAQLTKAALHEAVVKGLCPRVSLL